MANVHLFFLIIIGCIKLRCKIIKLGSSNSGIKRPLVLRGRFKLLCSDLQKQQQQQLQKLSLNYIFSSFQDSQLQSTNLNLHKFWVNNICSSLDPEILFRPRKVPWEPNSDAEARRSSYSNYEEEVLRLFSSLLSCVGCIAA